MTALTKNPMLKREAWCQYSVCLRYFASAEHFDYHRVGPYSDYRRRMCFTDEEMANLMVQTATGHWQSKKRVVQRLARKNREGLI